MANKQAAFLGPHSENLQIFEDLIVEVLRDYGYWRKNFHPEDENFITEQDKLDKTFLESVSKLRQELFKVLSELKNGTPFFSNRYFGHMNSDLLISSLTGYFAAMLYNQNNVVAESSPVTIKKELEYVNAIAEMIGYDSVYNFNRKDNDGSNYSWGHLCSGGTTANIEAIWAVRNLKYYPISLLLFRYLLKKDNNLTEALKLFLNVLDDFHIELPNSEVKKLIELSPFQLFSLSPDILLSLRQKIKASILKLVNSNNDINLIKEFEEKLPTINKLGYIKFMEICQENRIKFNNPVIIVPKSKHYCWPKLCDILGLGKDSLQEIELNKSFQIDTNKLEYSIDELIGKETPVLCVMAISGTTEEGAIDPLDEIVNLRKKLENQKNISFWLHSDAAYGGFFTTLKDTNPKLKKLNSLKDFDSIVIDPHKLGYIPYPAGLIIYRNSKIREHITFEAPYLSDNEDIEKAFWGKWTLEGSRPGATAVSCYLSQHCYPYSSDGHGSFLADCLDTTNELSQLMERNNDDFQIKKLYEPELNIFCYVVASKKYIKSPEALNKLNYKIFELSTVSGNYHANHYQFILSKTSYAYKKYKEFIDEFLKKCGCYANNLNEDFELISLRTVIMNPLINDKKEYLDKFINYLKTTAEKVLPEVQIEIIKEIKEGSRLRVLVIEDIFEVRESLKKNLEMEFEISKAFDIDTVSSYEDALKKISSSLNYDLIIIDLKLSKDPYDFSGIKLVYELKEEKKFNNVIIYSSYINEIIESELKALGINDECIIKKGNELIKDCSEILNASISLLQE